MWIYTRSEVRDIWIDIRSRGRHANLEPCSETYILGEKDVQAYVLVRLPLKLLRPSIVLPELVSSYSRRKGTLPPAFGWVVGNSPCWVLVTDGNHRTAAATRRRNKTMRVFLPLPHYERIKAFLREP